MKVTNRGTRPPATAPTGAHVGRRVGRHFGRAVEGLIELYVEREPGSRYDWHLALGVGVMIGAPLIAGDVTGHSRGTAQFAVAAWLTAIAVPKPDLRSRCYQYLLAAALYTTATTIGIITRGEVWAVLSASTILAAAIPLPSVGIVPLLSMVIAIPSGDDGSLPQHVLLFGAGSLWAGCVMMIPVVGGRYRPRQHSGAVPLRIRPDRWLRSASQSLNVGSPSARYAFRASCAFDLAYLGTSWLHTPDPTWLLIGILTTLRQSWGDTQQRVVKRLIGTAAGCVLTGATLWLLPGHGIGQLVLIAVCAAIARPMRGFNYGFWPIFNTPVLLILIEFGSHLTFGDVGFRMSNNLIGAAIAVVATLLLWPSREREQISERVAALLEAHAKLIEAASPESPLHIHLSHETDRARTATAELVAARARLADQPRDQRLLGAVDELLRCATTLRRDIDGSGPRWPGAQGRLLGLAAGLSRAAEFRATGTSLAAHEQPRVGQSNQPEADQDTSMPTADLDALEASVYRLSAAALHAHELSIAK
jgi:hypothetical protein